MRCSYSSAHINGSSIKPEAKRRVYWTNVSTYTKVWIGNVGNQVREKLNDLGVEYRVMPIRTPGENLHTANASSRR